MEGVLTLCENTMQQYVLLQKAYTQMQGIYRDAGGLLLQFRKSSTVCILHMLHSILQPLARLSKCLQSSEGNMCSAMELVKTVIEDLEEYDFDKHQIEIAASRSN